MGERGCGGLNPLGLRRDSLTALSRGVCGEGSGCGFGALAISAQLLCSGEAGLWVWVGTLALPALCAHLCAHTSRVTPSQVPS